MDVVLINRIQQIDKHNYQKIMSNDFQQGCKYEPLMTNQTKSNKYVRAVNVSLNKHEVEKEVYICKTLFEKLVSVFENIYLLDMTEYRGSFFNSISMEMYKSVSKRCNVLKQHMFDFIYETTYKLPPSKDVLVLFSNILKKNIIVVYEKDFYVYNAVFEATITITSSTTNVHDCMDSALYELTNRGYYEYIDLNTAKVGELREYIKRYNLNVEESVKKRSALIERIRENKN